MKYVKMLGLLAVAAAALMAFVGTASAATATSPPGTLYTGNIHAYSAKATRCTMKWARSNVNRQWKAKSKVTLLAKSAN